MTVVTSWTSAYVLLLLTGSAQLMCTTQCQLTAYILTQHNTDRLDSSPMYLLWLTAYSVKACAQEHQKEALASVYHILGSSGQTVSSAFLGAEVQSQSKFAQSGKMS